jgi:hypothetical protein
MVSDADTAVEAIIDAGAAWPCGAVRATLVRCNRRRARPGADVLGRLQASAAASS